MEHVPLYGRRLADGQIAISLHEHERLGYRFFARDFGIYVIERDLSRIRCAPTHVAPWQWQRFLTSQVLPLVALLHGIEVFHASAVALAEHSIALVGGSGVGKTSLAVNLVRRGAAFFADDVLTLERSGEGIVAHPGAAVANLRRAEAALIAAADGRLPGDVVGEDAEDVRVAMRREHRPLPLAAVYFLERSDRVGALAIKAIDDPYLILGSTFNVFVRTPDRLRNQLEICARIASSAGTFRAVIPPGVGAADVAQALEEHVEEVVTKRVASDASRP